MSSVIENSAFLKSSKAIGSNLSTTVVGLGMRTHANPCRARKLGHSRNVAIERVEVDDGGRGVDGIDGRAVIGGVCIHTSHLNIRGAHMTTSGQLQMIAIMISSAITNGAAPSSTSDSLPRPRIP